jgi:hypothetical protein
MALSHENNIATKPVEKFLLVENCEQKFMAQGNTNKQNLCGRSHKNTEGVGERGAI